MHETQHVGGSHPSDPHADHSGQARRDAPPTTGHGGHEASGRHAGHSVATFRERFWRCSLLTLPILVWSEMVQEWFGYTAPTFPGSDRIPAAFGTIVFVYGGMVFLQGGLRELRSHRPGMMVLISLAILVAFASSVASELGWVDLEFWWELGLLIDVMLLGHWQEMRALGQASSALDALAALLPDEADLVADGGVRSVPSADLAVGDLVLVRPGARVPADGRVEDGEAELDESMVTGESRAVPRRAGDRVVAGTVVAEGSLRVRIGAVGEDTALAGIRRLVEQAQSSRSRAQALADRAAALLFYVAVAAGILTFVVWAAIGEMDQAVERTVAVLVISCPHALGLAIPLVIAISTAVAARAGILITDRLALERMRTVDAVLFDKTGTLTAGEPVVRGVEPVDRSERELLSLAAAAESDSEHPLARAIVRAAEVDGSVPRASGFRATAGRGVEATVEGLAVRVGGPAMLRELGIEPAGDLSTRTAVWSERGATVIWVIVDQAIAGAVALEDGVRSGSADAIRELHDVGVDVVMITGDARPVAEAVAADLGVDEVLSEVLPEDKADAVARFASQGRRVAMVGDGVNDAPALARADVGIAIGAGTDVAIGSAGVVLAGDDPRGVVSIRRLSAASYRKMRQNLAWAAGYNVVAIPLAAGAFAWAGFVLPPAAGALAMSLSTIIVAANAMLLRRLAPRIAPGGPEP
jgi:P-type Cu2+ transporter